MFPNIRINAFFVFLALLAGLNSAPSFLIAETDEETIYVCPPCGHDCLKTQFNAPGACGECGMKLVELQTALNQPAMAHPAGERKKVAILVFEEVQIIDYTGPWEIFGQAGFEVFTVAKEEGMITSVFGLKIQPDYNLNNHPEPDILLIPGGQVFNTQNDPVIKEWLNRNAQKAEIVLSVCNGAFILAKAGLLNGLKATATRALVHGLANAAPNITIVEDTRFVDTGKIITSGGLSSGMDAALHVVSRVRGEEVAKNIARGLEYQWNSQGIIEP